LGKMVEQHNAILHAKIIAWGGWRFHRS
jgi:hypothetical protein